MPSPTSPSNALLGLLSRDSDQMVAGASTMPGIDMTRYALVCFGLVAVILILAWGFRRFLAGNLKMRANQRAMKVVDVLPLGSKRQLAVVKCYDRTFLIGMGEREVNLVTELDADEDVEGKLKESSLNEGLSFKGQVQRAAHPDISITEAPAQQTPREGKGLGRGILG